MSNIQFPISNGLIAHGRIGDRGTHHDWVSRDYEEIDCRAVGCFWNRGEKCTVPSLCKIGDDGRCEGFRARGDKGKVDGD